MSSISKFEEPILEVKSLDIGFSIQNNEQYGLRDKFVSLIQNPSKIIWKNKNIHTVLKDFDLTINKGDRLGLLGVNGTGKTSLCRTIAGMYGNRKNILAKGKVRAIFNTEIGIIPELTGKENAHLLCSLMYPDLSKKEKNELVLEAIEFSELNEFQHRPFHIYSKGMKARLFLSIVSALPCDLLILDEVFDGADIFFNEKITKRIKNIIDRSGSVIFVSHSLDQIRETCNRLVILHQKKKSYDGPVEQGIEYYLKNCGLIQ